MLNTNSNINLQNNSSIKLMNENNFNYLDRYKPQENHKFGRGHIIRQYMSGVGVITERYISNDHLLFFESRNTLDQSMSTSDIKSVESKIEEEQQKEKVEQFNTTTSINCPCYDKAYKKELKKNRSFKNIVLSIFKTIIPEIIKLLEFGSSKLEKVT